MLCRETIVDTYSTNPREEQRKIVFEGGVAVVFQYIAFQHGQGIGGRVLMILLQKRADAPFAEFLLGGVHRFADPVGVEQQQIVRLKSTVAYS